MSHALAKFIDGTLPKEPTDAEIKQVIGDLNPEMVSYLVQGMIDKKLPSTKIMSFSIELCANPFGLALISIALRLGANANVYIQAPELGDVHVLGFVARNKSRYDPKIYIIILSLLILYGSKVNSPIFNQSTTLIKDVPVSAISVADWYYNNGYGNELIDLGSEGLFLTMNSQIRSDLAALTDKVELLSNPTLDNIELAILAQAKNMVSKFIYMHHNSEGDLRKLYDWTFKYYASNIPTELLKSRVYPHYYQINNLLLKMKVVANLQYQTLLLQLVGVLKNLVIAGVDLDVYQFTILKTISPNIAKTIGDAYASPYWKKSCEISNAKGDASQRLLQLAKALQYDGGVGINEVCSFIKKVSDTDQQKILVGAIVRQKERISVNNSSPGDYINNKPIGVCYNAAVSGDEIYEYSDFDLATYKDNEGHIYCFTRDLFPILLQEKVNPYSKQPLPPSFIESLARQQQMLMNLGMMGPPETLGSGLKRLGAPDVISNDIDISYKNEFLALGRKYGINDEVLLSIAPPVTTTLLSNLGYETDMSGLIPEHQYVTFVRTFMDELRQNPSKAQPFFDYLRIVYTTPFQPAVSPTK